MNYFFKSNKKTKTPNWLIGSFSFFLVFIYYLLIWILFGEINLLGFNFLIAAQNRTFMGKEIEPIFDLVLLWFLFVPLLIYLFLAFFLFAFTKYIIWELIPFCYSTAFTLIVLFLSGIIPMAWNSWIILLRFFLVLITLMLSFFLLNKMTNFFLIRSKYAIIIAENLLKTGKSKTKNRQKLQQIQSDLERKKSAEIVFKIKKKKPK
ncbi:MPN565 family protein [Mycoplasmoides genitalium]|nr:hypothetical protein [Mycoplasmoides genitalium]AFQ03228.1 hypothetical protein CM9_02310 [Mycoplasmoides genitalium M2321]AFQ04723.1 hypothetical protein CM5_02275 [Mycoplasmoides genitalium M2288]